jgi:hypothetical protein
MSKYEIPVSEQLSLGDFYQPAGLIMAETNRWVERAKQIPWRELEIGYAEEFKDSKRGPKPLPLRLVLGALIIRQELKLSDEETVQQIAENPYLQFFVGYPGYEYRRPFDPSTLTRVRKRLGDERIDDFSGTIEDWINAGHPSRN